MIDIIVKKIHDAIAFVTVLFIIESPMMVLFFKIEDNQQSFWYYILFALFFAALPGAIDMIRNIENENWFLAAFFSTVAGLVIMGFGFFSDSPWETRAMLGSVASFVIFIFKSVKHEFKIN